jgi:hypothetical protein
VGGHRRAVLRKADRYRHETALVALVGTLGVVSVVSVGTVACGGMEQPPPRGSMPTRPIRVGCGVTHILTTDGVRRMRLEAESVYAYAGRSATSSSGSRSRFSTRTASRPRP